MGLKYLYDTYKAHRYQTKLFRFLKKFHTKKKHYAHSPDPLGESLLNPEDPLELQLCLICHDDIEEGQMVIEIPECAHSMHEDCLIEWLKKNPSCPHCRSKIQIPPDFK